LPEKKNVSRRRGLDALTGSSNFDLSEAMLVRLVDSLEGKPATLAMLVKTTVARKLLEHIWRTELPLTDSKLFPLDARAQFGATVDACLLVASFDRTGVSGAACRIHSHWDPASPATELSFLDGHLIADGTLYRRHRCL